MINQKLRAAREKNLWTMADAAAAVGVSEQTWSRWENGARKPHISTLKMLCEAFSATPGELGFGHLVYQSTVEISPTWLGTKPILVTPVTSSVDMFEIGLMALIMAQQQNHWTVEDLQSHIEQTLRELDAMTIEKPDQGGISRRQALGFFAGLPIAIMGATQMAPSSASSLTPEEVLPLYASGIPACWRLYFAGGLAEVRRVLPDYITQTVSIVQRSPKYQQVAASLASKAYQLEYLLALQRQDFGNALTQARLAFQYADLADDNNLRLASLVRQGNVFFALKRPLQCVQKYSEAIQYNKGTSSLLLGQAYIGLAEAQARMGLAQEAQYSHGLALDTFPGVPEDDPQYEYTHFNHFTLANFRGLMYLRLEQPQEAWQVFTQADKIIPQGLVPRRVELLSRQAATSLELGDLEQTSTYLEKATIAALKLGSELRFSENDDTYLQIQARWPSEKRVKALGELFQRK
ncbi:MAG TPA: helix-turn-helix transcriptional regulator [Ktedonobacteraceae bacterium]|nr:helix-turn-helix transcriptional regulator [Ktedonobacteraceae bacterium]